MQLEKRRPSESLYLQITKILRTHILTQCQPGEKLDSERKLAEHLGISILTLSKALNGLAHEGLLERRPGSGTYVTNTSARRHVAIWTGYESEVLESNFFLRVTHHLAVILEQQGYRYRLYVALGPQGRRLGEEFETELACGRVWGAAIVSAGPVEALARHQVPFVTTGGASFPYRVEIDRVKLVRDGTRYLLERGCRKIALMASDVSVDPAAADRVRAAFQTLLAEHGVAVADHWIRTEVPATVPGAGWEQFREIWSAREDKPDGLLVTDDVLFRSVALGILDSQIKVPEQLQVVVHANKGSGMTYPFPMAQLVVDPEEYAQAMAETLIQVMDQQPVAAPQRVIEAQLVPPGAIPAPAAPAGGTTSSMIKSLVLASIALATAWGLAPATACASHLFVSSDAGAASHIYAYTPGGVQSTFTSGVNNPQGLAFDSAGNLFVADGGSHNIYKFTSGGVPSTFASSVSGLVGLAVDSAGDVFVASDNNSASHILKFTPGGVQTTFASGLYNPQGLAFDSAGNLFEADYSTSTIFKFTPGGAQSTFASGLGAPAGLAFDSAGNLFETDFGSGHIYEFTPGGVRSTFASGLNGPCGLAFDSAGNLFEADYNSGFIYEFTPGGSRSTFASGLATPVFLAMEPLPEPSTVLLLGLGGLLVRRFTRRQPRR